MSFMIVFFFYKNILFTLGQFFYAFFNHYSRQSLYNDWLITFFNMTFTTFGIGLFALFEQDIPSKKSENLVPDSFLYFFGQKNYGFNQLNFAGWMFSATFESLFIFFWIKLIDMTSVTFSTFRCNNYELVSTLIYTIVLVQIMVKLFLYTRHLTFILFSLYIITGLLFFLLYVSIGDVQFGMTYFRTLRIIWNNPLFYLNLLFFVITLFALNFAMVQLR